MDKLFDILICKCKFSECMVCPKDCTSAHIECVCARKFKIPKQDLFFIKDQREKVGHNGGKMIIYGSKKGCSKRSVKKRARMKRTKVSNPDRLILTLMRMILKENHWILKSRMILCMFQKKNLIVMLWLQQGC